MIIAQPHHRSRQEITAHDPTHLVQQIKSSTQQSGVSFGYMVATARVESNFDPQARAKTSSASGLYQFTSGTWLKLVKTHGSKHGLETLASQIDEQGRVADPAIRQTILELRHDPKIAIKLGIDFTRDNQISLENSLNRRVNGGELYLAHFMGASQAGQFLATIDKNPNTRAADLFPKAAAANPSVFFDKEGNAKTVSAIMQNFTQKIDAKVAGVSP
ncbi:MAG: transglycosylase SLT domain-containing protein, partial [Alphaproteobacteria bacterium]|nr:transglycosylase SLT domain-containing protein [Alphaproteobacteria bacterium]